MQRCAVAAAALGSGLFALLGWPASPAAVDWGQVATSQMVLFQNGVASWEWLLVPATHDVGGRRMREGRTCLSCHEGEETAIGNIAASGRRLEPNPLPGMPGTLELQLQAARDDTHLHLRLSWPSLTGGARAGDAEAAVRVTVMLGDDALSVAPIAGCWAACHNDMVGMPNAQPGQDLTKYLPNSRTQMTATGGGTGLRSAADLAAELARGAFLEYWQVELDEAGGVRRALDGYMLEARHANDASELSATARRDGDRWVVEMSRPLTPAGGPRKVVAAGRTYTVAFAIHDNYATKHYHYVGFPRRMVLDAGEAELVVRRH
jgi:hypothetical protein